MTTFLGMRGTGDWQTDQRPKNWRETILYLYPNGSAPLTAILSKMMSEKTDDPQFYWWTKMLDNQGGELSGVYGDAGLSSDPGSTIAAGKVLYVKVKEDVASHFRAGHQALLRASSDNSEDCNGKVLDVVKNGDNSYIVFKALQASSGDPQADFNRILVIGNINPEGAPTPDAITYDPVKWFNYTQIFRTPLSITRTARQTRLRTGDQYKQAKAEALEIHSIEMEKAFLFGYPSEQIGSNGKPERTTMGLINAIRGVASFDGYPGDGYAGVVSDFPSTHSGVTWLDGGEDWIDEQLERIFRYGDTEKLGLCGNGVLLGIQRLVKNKGNFDFKPTTEAYGIRVTRWYTVFGTVNLVSHPLFNLEPSLRNTCVIFEPRNLRYRYIQDTTFYPADQKRMSANGGRIDGTVEEFLTEAGLEFHNPIGFGLLTGFNIDG